MKKKIFIAAVFMVVAGITSLHAQENAKKSTINKSKSNIKNNKVSVVIVSSTATGCAIAIADRDASSGMATGKRMHKPFVITKQLDISAADNTVTESTGSGVAGIAGGAVAGKGGKASVKDMVIMMQIKGKSIPLSSDNGEYEIPADCPNGDYKMVASWSWGQSNGGSSKRCDKTFTLTMEDGVCKGITQSGIK
ncbi:hypothetical protein BH11BAC3_BH11BAC3_28690 [soil metagenome]